MKFSFLPGDLHLDRSLDGVFRVTVAGQEVLASKSQKVAVSKFHELRAEMEQRFPSRDLTADEKHEIMKAAIGDSLVGHNSTGGRKKKTSAGGTRTFGG